MQEESKSSEAIPQTAREMADQCIYLVTAYVDTLSQALDEIGRPDLGREIQAEYRRWGKETLMPALDRDWDEIQTQFEKIRPILLQIAEDPMRMLDKHWELVKGNMPAGVDPEGLVAALLLQPSPRPIPPGHPVLKVLGVSSEGEWNRLIPARQWLRLMDTFSGGERKKLFVRRGTKLMLRWTEDETRKSVSSDHVLPGGPTVEPEDPASTRFVQHLEANDELDHLLARVHLSPSERITAAGMRQDLTGEALVEYVLQQPGGQGLSQKSIPVLASKIRSKLRAAARQ